MRVREEKVLGKRFVGKEVRTGLTIRRKMYILVKFSFLYVWGAITFYTKENKKELQIIAQIYIYIYNRSYISITSIYNDYLDRYL